LLPSTFNPHEWSAEDLSTTEEEEVAMRPPKDDGVAWMRKLSGSGSWHRWDSWLAEQVAAHSRIVTILAIICIMVTLAVLVYAATKACKWVKHQWEDKLIKPLDVNAAVSIRPVAL
jgi:hypothetical protein